RGAPVELARLRRAPRGTGGVVVALVAIALGSACASAGATAARRGDADLSPRVYVVMPSSEAEDIDGASDVQAYETPAAAPGYGLGDLIPLLGLKPHPFAPVPGRNIALIGHFTPISYVEVFNLVKNEIVGTIPTGLGPRHISYNPKGTVAYTANHDGD